jgi:uncharacterized integral membrane protein
MSHEPRKLLGKSSTMTGRTALYQIQDGLEIESNEQYDIVQRRVLFDDVLMVTIHREIGAIYLVVTGLIAAFFLGIALVILSFNVDAWPAALIFGIFGAPALLAFLIRLFLGVDVVTIFGRRSKASIRYAIRKTRARALYGSVCSAVRIAHRQAEREGASAAAPAADGQASLASEE